MNGGARKLKRVRTEADPVPRPDRQVARAERRLTEVVVEQEERRPKRPPLVAILVALAVLALLVPIVLWARYQITHVVSRNALVKGSITSVGAQLAGVVTGVEVDAGQRVVAGQVLARFEDHQLQAAVQRARSRFEKTSRELVVERMAIVQEQRRLEGLVMEATARTAAARAQVDAAQTQAEDAKARHEQKKSLAEAGAIAPEELRIAETTSRTAEAQAASARADRSAVDAARRLAEVESDGIAVRKKHIMVLEADVDAARAELTLAEADLKAAVIRAPADGWVLRRIAEPGASVVVGQPMVALWLGKEVWVEAWIEEDDLAKVAPGSQVMVTVKPYPRRVFSGTVESVGATTDYEIPDAAVPQPRNARIRSAPVVCVRVRLDHADGLFPGLSAVVGIRKKAGT